MPALLYDTSIVQEPRTHCQWGGRPGPCTERVVGIVHRMDNATRRWHRAFPLCNIHLLQ